MTNRKCGQQWRRAVKLKTKAKNRKLKNYPKCFRGGLRKMISMAKYAQNDQTCSTQKIAKYDEKGSFFFNVERNNINVNKNASQKWHIRCKVGQS